MRNQIIALKNLGRMPDESLENIPINLVEQYEQLLASIEDPISSEEAKELIKLFPEHGLFGLEWTLLHLIESTPNWPIEELISLNPSKEWRQIMVSRSKK